MAESLHGDDFLDGRISSATEDLGTLFAAMARGARAFIPKSSSIPVTEAALKLAVVGGTYAPFAALAGAGIALALTERQFEVFRFVIKGLRQIAKHLAISGEHGEAARAPCSRRSECHSGRRFGRRRAALPAPGLT